MTKPKVYALPRKTRQRLSGVGFRLSLHVDKDAAGNPVPYALDEKKRPLWKYTVRVGLADGTVKCRNHENR